MFFVLENESENLKCEKLSKLPELLERECVRARSLAEKNRENASVLQHQTHTYLSVSQWRAESGLCESAGSMSESALFHVSL